MIHAAASSTLWSWPRNSNIVNSARTIVLTGSGKNFSYGLDLPAMGATLPGLDAGASVFTTSRQAPPSGMPTR